MTPRRVAVVGGGIAGLALAAGLDPDRFEVVLHEAEPERKALGAPLGLWPSALKALARVGAEPKVEKPGAGRLYSITGRPLSPITRPGLLAVPRPELLAGLEAAVPPSVRRVEQAVADPASLDADLVVGADGVRSVVRGLVHPRAAERVETPYVALRGVRPAATPSLAGEYWGRGLIFGLMPFGPSGAKREYWFTTHRSDLGPEPLDAATVLAEARERFAGAARVVRGALEQAGPDTIATRLWVAPPLPTYVRGRYVVVGDAAHAATPNLGRGACDAIVDAVTLAEALNAEGDLRRWQAKRLPLTQAARATAGTVMRAVTRS